MRTFQPCVGVLGLSLLASPLPAQQMAAPSLRSFSHGVLVTSDDVRDCPYTVIGAVSVNMRAHSYSLKELQPDAIGDKLRKQAAKLHADAIILVTVGESHMTLTSLRSTPITGRAIRYQNRGCAPTS